MKKETREVKEMGRRREGESETLWKKNSSKCRTLERTQKHNCLHLRAVQRYLK